MNGADCGVNRDKEREKSLFCLQTEIVWRQGGYEVSEDERQEDTGGASWEYSHENSIRS